MADKKIDPKAPESDAKSEGNAARVEKKTSLKRKRSLKKRTKRIA